MQADLNDLWKLAETRHPSMVPPTDLNAPLWRYLPAEKFRWLVENRRLYMPRLEQLAHNDPLEGTMPAGEAAWWRQQIRSAKSPDDAKQMLQNFQTMWKFVEQFRQGWFVSCWTMGESENFAFWQIYGRNESRCATCEARIVNPSQSVAIRTTFRQLEDALPAYVDLGMVRYSDYNFVAGGYPNVYDYVMRKRHFYEYEKEVRAIAHTQLGTISSPAATLHVQSMMFGNSYAPTLNIHALIDEVLLHPESSEKFAVEMRALCREHALPEPRISGLLS